MLYPKTNVVCQLYLNKIVLASLKKENIREVKNKYIFQSCSMGKIETSDFNYLSEEIRY